jgi:hypothetical protein
VEYFHVGLHVGLHVDDISLSSAVCCSCKFRLVRVVGVMLEFQEHRPGFV